MAQNPPPPRRRRVRRLILGRSVIVGVLGSVPVPQVEEALSAAVRRGLLRRLAALRQVDIEDDALDALVAESEARQRLDTVLAIGNLLLALRSGRARALRGVLSLRRFEQALRTYDQAALFDHYCARHHLGPGIDRGQAGRLRQDFDQAAQDTHRELASQALGAVAGGALRALGAAAGRVAAAVREHRLGAAPVLLSSAATAVGALVSDARSRAVSLRRVGPSALLSVVNAGLDRYTGRLASAFDRSAQSAQRAGGAPRRGADDDEEGGEG